MKKLLILIIYFIVILNIKYLTNANPLMKTSLNPIILVPGLGGSQLFANLNKTESSHFYCEKKSNGYFNIWVNPEEILPFAIECFIENLKLNYNPITKRTENSPGVDIKAMNFGQTSDIEYLNPSIGIGEFDYFADLVNALIPYGYIRNESIHAIPYDFRRAPDEHDELFNNWKNLIEQTSLNNNGRKSIIICHSLGCLMSVYFLNEYSTKSWKDNYIQSLIIVSAPLSGAMEALEATLSGFNFGLFFYSNSKFHKMQRTFPTASFLYPSTRGWNHNDSIVITPWKNYTVNDIRQLLIDTNDNLTLSLYDNTVNLLPTLDHPGVDVLCVYTKGTQTLNRIYYDRKDNFPSSPSSFDYGDGDGTVSLNSLQSCLQWKENKSFYFQSNIIENTSHFALIKHKQFFNILINYINGI